MTAPREDITPIFAELAARLGFELQPLRPTPRPWPPDTGDVIDPDAPDPTPDEIPAGHPDHVQPWAG